MVASAPPDASESDQSFLGLECDGDVSRARLSSELRGRVAVGDHGAGSSARFGANVLVEVEGALPDDDERLRHLGSVLRRPVVLGSYAMPIPGGGR